MEMFIEKSVSAIRARTGALPSVGMILGSGLGSIAERIEEPVSIPYKEIPFFPPAGVEGHAGKLIIGRMGGRIVAAMQGRPHFYEGYSMGEVAYPVRALRALGVKTLIVTTASGAVGEGMAAGSLMLIADHINMMGDNPLRDEAMETGSPCFVDLSRAYFPPYLELMEEIALNRGITLRRGVFMAFRGPSYETPAEIRMGRAMGADAVSMSTVPEVIMAARLGMRVLAVACITNSASGLGEAGISHQEVLSAAGKAAESLSLLLDDFIRRVGEV